MDQMRETTRYDYPPNGLPHNACDRKRQNPRIRAPTNQPPPTNGLSRFFLELSPILGYRERMVNVPYQP